MVMEEQDHGLLEAWNGLYHHRISYRSHVVTNGHCLFSSFSNLLTLPYNSPWLWPAGYVFWLQPHVIADIMNDRQLILHSMERTSREIGE